MKYSVFQKQNYILILIKFYCKEDFIFVKKNIGIGLVERTLVVLPGTTQEGLMSDEQDLIKASRNVLNAIALQDSNFCFCALVWY